MGEKNNIKVIVAGILILFLLILLFRNSFIFGLDESYRFLFVIFNGFITFLLLLIAMIGIYWLFKQVDSEKKYENEN